MDHRQSKGQIAGNYSVARHIFDGQGESRIAFLLGISHHTVHTHVKHIYAKLGVHDQRELLLRVFAEYLNSLSGASPE